MTRFLMAAIEQAKSVESNKLVEALESLRFKDDNQDVGFREWTIS
jgi:hypothetical protein